MHAPAPARLVPLSTTAATLDASPLNILRSMHGPIVGARIAYPEVLHVEIKDSAGELITPGGVVLEFGLGGWQIGSADSRASWS